MAKDTPAPAGEQEPAARRFPRNSAHKARQVGEFTGQRLGDYLLQELLGIGGMSDVYRANDLVLMRDVAVKVLASALAEDSEYVERFRTEARRVAALSHPSLIPVYHAGEDTVGGRRLLYLVMPLLQESLDDVLQREGKLPPAEAASLVLQVADGLQVAHAKGLIHRDVKPGNILLDAEGKALLADFGLARDIKRPPHEITRQPWGTPEYMAPEQLHGDTVDQRADVYALGVVLYELLTGKRPFDGSSAYDIAAQALSGPLKPPSTYEPAISSRLDDVVLMALARERGARYPGMAEFIAALHDAAHDAASQRPEHATDVGDAVTTPLPNPSRSSLQLAVQAALRGSRRRSLRWLLGFMVAVSVLAVGFGVALPAIQRQWQSARTLSGASNNGSLGQVSPTSTGDLLSNQTPIATPNATNTPSARPTTAVAATAVTTATAQPLTTLTLTPTPLVLTQSATNPKTCSATQTVTNNTASTVGWAWQKPTISGFHFQIDGKPSVGWPTTTTSAPPGGQNTLVVTADCKAQAISYAVLVKDTLGGQYTFIMTIQ